MSTDILDHAKAKADDDRFRALTDALDRIHRGDLTWRDAPAFLRPRYADAFDRHERPIVEMIAGYYTARKARAAQ